MKANELRIGNYVHNPIQKIDFKVDITTLSEVFYDEKREVKLNNKFQPIPLTEEWLFKFGLEKKNGYGFEMFGNWIQKEDNIYWYNLNGNFVILKHVHQLQNLYFALTQKEMKCLN